MKNSFRFGIRSTTPRPKIAREPQHVRIVGEQPVEAIGRNTHRHGVEAPPALIALQHRHRAEIEAEPRAVDHRFRQRRDIAQPHIQPLPRDRMDHMRGVADQRDALGDEARAQRTARADRRGADRPPRCRRDAVRSAVPARREIPRPAARRCDRPRPWLRSTRSTSVCPSAAGSRTARREGNALRRGHCDRAHARPW